MPEKQDNFWTKYWNSNNIWTDSPIWVKNAELFIHFTKDILNYNSADVVLDIGCGSGNLVDLLRPKVKKIVCVDTAENYVNRCREKFNKYTNVDCYKLPEDDTRISFINQRFSIIIALSVVQYFKAF